MSEQFIVAIDGGGSSTDFAWVSPSGEIDYRVTIHKASNPNYVGVEASLAVIDEGLTAGQKYFPKESVLFTYAAIAGCEKPNATTKEIEAHIAQLGCPVVVAGDLDASYRSHTASKHGILLVAGTGDSIAVYKDGSEKRFQSSVAYGGRKFGAMLLLNLRRHPDRFPIVIKTLEEKLGGLDVYFQMQGQDLFSHQTVNDFSSLLIDVEETHAELEPLLEYAGLRWAIVASSLSELFGLDFAETRPCVLAGSLWHWDCMRLTLSEELERLRNVETLWDPTIKPIEGAAGLALEQWQQHK